jgi:hypothetical protein
VEKLCYGDDRKNSEHVRDGIEEICPDVLVDEEIAAGDEVKEYETGECAGNGFSSEVSTKKIPRNYHHEFHGLFLMKVFRRIFSTTWHFLTPGILAEKGVTF